MSDYNFMQALSMLADMHHKRVIAFYLPDDVKGMAPHEIPIQGLHVNVTLLQAHIIMTGIAKGWRELIPALEGEEKRRFEELQLQISGRCLDKWPIG